MQNKWFKAGNWSPGIRQKIDSTVNISQFYEQYHKRPDLWEATLGFLKNDLVSMKPGKYVLKENELTAIISEYPTKTPEEAKWEAHRKFIDLQYVITGEEKIGLLPIDQAQFPETYQDEKDVIFFGEQNGQYLVADPDVYFLFFPDDVHRPGLQRNGSGPVKKLVIKIAYIN